MRARHVWTRFCKVAGTWPGDMPDARRRKILGLNAAELYKFDVEKLMPLAREHGPTPEEVNTPLPKDEIPRDSMCYLFTNALYGV